MIKRIIKGIVLAVFFAGALLISNYVMNRGTDDKIMTMGEPTLPVVSFTVSGQEINLLSGYVDQMDVTAMRDTITPLESNGTLQAEIAENGNKISKISYKVYSLDGADTYAEGKVKEEDGKVTLELGTALDQSAQEAVLKLTLTLGSGEAQKKVNYFTRIEKPDEITAWKCLTFAKDFHAKALDQSDEDTLSMYLEPGEESDNTTYQTVNIHSDITHIQWGDLNPEIVGDVQWSLKESNSVYTSILAKYQVRCQDDKEETARYNVKEFFRIRSVGDTIYLLDYNRDLQEVFSSSRSVMDQKGILLGIVPEDVPYETNKKDSILAFVQNRTLWMYNKKNEELTKVFSFAEEDTQDVRSLNDQHAVRIISMDDHGNIAFAVYGYMNRGEHEGEVGVGIYYFNVDSNLIQEKGFIPSTKSFAIAEDELGKMVYYNHAQELLYVLADQVLYRIDLDKNQQEVLAKGLEAGKYAVSDDGHQLAYQTDGEKDAAKEIRVMDLSSGDEYSVKAAKNEAVRPLGFLNGDFIYGILRTSDAGKTASGEKTTPMYQLEIHDSKNKKIAEYSFADQGIYISDILIEGNMVTLNRLAKAGEIYNVTSQEYITNNVEKKDTKISLTSYSSEKLGKQYRFTFAEGIEKTEVKLLQPDQQVAENALTIVLKGKDDRVKYYVYGMGELVGIYDKAGYAIQKAEKISGVVISSEQAYVWEKGNRDLVYSIDDVAVTKESGESSLEACERYMKAYEAEKTDLTGCTLDQVLYVINKGCPVIALTSADHAILMTGYSKTDITYSDPDTGASQTVTMDEMNAMVAGSGNTFIGYIK